ncbi:recombinase family protein [Microvirga sp. HBU67558]|uniref:recombinase family protein n=1 Tax=Microvirga sp. HBU67558 TaxID=2824562 RepID=UPI001B38CDE7|nr:recombinase family protein [Microvirga sp. HBU67558]MBQ0820714.1 recombinase family protein [Microvirga sp. HBU67558]
MTPSGSMRVQRLKRRASAVKTARAEVASKAVGYVRVSSEEQAASGFGLATQEAAIRAFAASQGYELLEVVTDAGVSGATRPAERDGFRRIVDLAEEGAFSVLLVWKFDRLARQIVYAVTAANDLQERHGVQLRSVTEPIDTATPMGRTVFAILAGMAEQERQVITERTFLGRREKASRGGFAGGSAPLGYRKDRQGGLVEDQEASGTVRRIFAMKAEGATLQAIANCFNSEGIPTARGGKWWPATVRYILDNPKYRGQVEYLFRWNGSESHIVRPGTHAVIVENA